MSAKSWERSLSCSGLVEVAVAAAAGDDVHILYCHPQAVCVRVRVRVRVRVCVSEILFPIDLPGDNIFNDSDGDDDDADINSIR